jgi:serine/threonine-protein kinase RsbW
MTIKISPGSSPDTDFKDGSEPALPEPICVGPTLYVGLTMRSEIEAISPFLDRFMPLIKVSHCVPGDAHDVEISLREALANAALHGNGLDIQKRVHISCCIRPGKELSIVVKDEGSGFDATHVPDPTAVENIHSEKVRGIHLMKLLMHEVHFEHGGTEVHLQKGFKQKIGWPAGLSASSAHEQRIKTAPPPDYTQNSARFRLNGIRNSPAKDS